MKIKFHLVFTVIFLFLTCFIIAGEQYNPADFDKDLRCKKTPPPLCMNKTSFGMEGILHLSEKLNLSGEQIEKIRQIRDDAKKDIVNARKEIKKSMDALQNEFKKTKPDRDKINKLIDEISSNQKKMMVIRTEQMLKIKEILTPEQFKKLINIFEKHKKKFKKIYREMEK
ncbi:MAG: Spy/CpxP family protein refolding chaperone [Candidatus Goldbacteria bacterium]|nr:Spy/CpxP family protein refolding chaperone [Candidatus Goldiibacteriota bacterium]